MSNLIKGYILISLFISTSVCQEVYFPSPKSPDLKQSPYWIDMIDINSINIGMSKDEIESKIGLPVQLNTITQSEGSKIEKYVYRTCEFGYSYMKGLKPDFHEKYKWAHNSYYLHFHYENDKLESIDAVNYIINERNQNDINYDHNFQYYFHNADTSMVPIWVDFIDLANISVGMNESNVEKQIGFPNQLIKLSENILLK